MVHSLLPRLLLLHQFLKIRRTWRNLADLHLELQLLDVPCEVRRVGGDGECQLSDRGRENRRLRPIKRRRRELVLGANRNCDRLSSVVGISEPDELLSAVTSLETAHRREHLFGANAFFNVERC